LVFKGLQRRSRGNWPYPSGVGVLTKAVKPVKNGANGGKGAKKSAGASKEKKSAHAVVKGGNGGGAAALKPDNPQLDPAQVSPEIAKKIIKVRSQVRESFGNVAMAMMMLPRYRHQTLGDLQHLLLEPLIRDRIAIAYPGGKDRDPMSDVTGMAIWASVSEEVDAKIRDQIKSGTFPVRLQAQDWNSGDINWLLDIIAPDKKTTTSVIANFKQVVKEGNLRLHPIVTRLVDEDVLEKMGAQKMGETPLVNDKKGREADGE